MQSSQEQAQENYTSRMEAIQLEEARRMAAIQDLPSEERSQPDTEIPFDPSILYVSSNEYIPTSTVSTSPPTTTMTDQQDSIDVSSLGNIRQTRRREPRGVSLGGEAVTKAYNHKTYRVDVSSIHTLEDVVAVLQALDLEIRITDSFPDKYLSAYNRGLLKEVK